MNGIELRDIVEKAGLQLVICGNGHFQIVGGKFLVNYYPNTRKGQKIYIASTKEGISVNSIEEVIHAANNLPVNLQSEERRANYTKQLKWLFRKALVMLSLRGNNFERRYNGKVFDLDWVHAVDINWNIKSHPTDISNVMKAEDCRFIGTYEECYRFINRWMFARNGA